jgi:hypothetical protein
MDMWVRKAMAVIQEEEKQLKAAKVTMEQEQEQAQ